MKAEALVEIPKCPHAKPRLSPDDFGDQLFLVVVGKGDNERRFTVFRNLLTYHSSYFRAALGGDWKESTQKTVNLPDDDPDVFRAFHHWLYYGTLYSQLTPEGKVPLSAYLIAKVYVFGDARGIPHLCNASVDLLVQKSLSEWVFCHGVLNYVYDNTPENCGLRRLLVKFGAETYRWTRNVRNAEQNFPRMFLMDVMIMNYEDGTYALGKCLSKVGRAKYLETIAKEACEYHDHGQAAADTSATKN
ncbi:uncharacterized protein EI97DRAFT_432564 [Westerdykella ornata]|uniref:BTB domain-containing protein n=1 Tax=Westerdykella ornata TaxID=318751 RepID=A0A6A6JL09_WESOR|nr:uncharacterized protein EI97DRAFT_432564 [Westerdykella ornata]KAF2276944.1 hypothetical protein EI97DRAFT_432564 [Westerdykella ornata]